MQVPWLEELARSYLETIGRNYTLEDLVEIAEQHIQLEERYSGLTDVLLLDTDPLTIEIWAAEKFGQAPSQISDIVKNRFYNLYLLCVPEMPWEFDPLRENPDDRDRLFQIYETKLIELSKNYTVIVGTPDERLSLSMKVIQKMLSAL